MKKIFLAMAFILISTGLSAANNNNEVKQNVFNSKEVQYPTCSASLKYTKTTVYKVNLAGDLGADATVIINCKQENDVYITVAAYKNNEHVGSDVVTVEAGGLSGSKNIHVKGCKINDEVELRIVY